MREAAGVKSRVTSVHRHQLLLGDKLDPEGKMIKPANVLLIYSRTKQKILIGFLRAEGPTDQSRIPQSLFFIAEQEPEKNRRREAADYRRSEKGNSVCFEAIIVFLPV